MGTDTDPTESTPAGDRSDAIDDHRSVPAAGAGDALAAMTERLARLQDEYLSYRARAQRQIDAASHQGAVAVCRSLLDTLDSFELVMAALGDDRLDRGVALAHEQLVAALVAVGMTRIGTPGEPFDPTRHEAVDTTAEAPADTVATVLRHGYCLESTVLRPASVSVGTAAPAGSGSPV